MLGVVGLFFIFGLFFFKRDSFNLRNNTSDGITKSMLEVFNKKGPSEALIWLRGEMYRKPEINRECHEVAHEIGRLAFNKFGNVAEAAKESDDVCNSGYLHGVIEEYFKINKDYLVSIKDVCRGYENKAIVWHCSHAIGHALMFISSNDLKWALDFCNNKYLGSERERCERSIYGKFF